MIGKENDMKQKVADLTGGALDWAVAEGLGVEPVYDHLAFDNHWEGAWIQHPYYMRLPKYSTDWAIGGPIIEREGISIDFDGRVWCASHNSQPIAVYGRSLLEAAMRCYVLSKFGDEIDLPKDI